MQAQVVFLFGRHGRNVAIQLLDSGKDFVQRDHGRLVRGRFKAITESVVNESPAIFELLFGGLGHFAHDGFNHPFAPLVNGKREFCRRHLRNQVIRQVQRNAIVFLGSIKNHLAHDHAAGPVETFDSELFEGTAELRFLRLGALFLVALRQGIKGAIAEARICIADTRFVLI